ncbi:hypothetical protein [Angustibacter sp. Root456]|uniref:hypothetical protein n=1 Tax=Angustibacter sp. Root456 TaxID=1736539 RepID=UPI0012F708DD|nr:hypothetical protein [Angustibacter sp. Root456]
MAPSGIPLASGAPDRDGLEMDVLQVPLGPVLVHWPAGLLLRCTLAGDVVTSAEAQLLRGGDLGPRTEQPSGTERAARSLDAASSVLALTGWSDPAGTAQRLRDRLVVDPPAEPASLIPDVEALRRQVTRSRMLRWTLRRTGPASGALATGSDVYARLLALLDDATAHLRGDLPSPDLDPASALEGLCDAVTGLELAAVRLVVASLDLRTDRLPAEAVLHG